MTFGLIKLDNAIMRKESVNKITKCNDFTSAYGLTLSEPQIIELINSQITSLKENGRVEFGGKVVEKIIENFYSSPYISDNNYLETIEELTDIFYFYKNETLDLMTDDDLIKFMRQSFDGICEGSLDVLSNQELDKMATNLRGFACDFPDNDIIDDNDDDEDEYNG